MRRLGTCLVLAALMPPVSAQAQKKPSNSMHTRSAEVYLDRVQSAASDGEREELLGKALEVLMRGAEADPGNPKIWFLAGQVYARMGDATGADSTFDRAEAIYPEYAPEIEPERRTLWITRYNRGVAALQAGDTEGAITEFEAANLVYGGRPDAALTLGSLYAQKGDLAGAEAAWRAALEIALGPASGTVEEGDRAEWLTQEEEIASRLADLFVQTGRPDDAIQVYRAVVGHQPTSSRAKVGLAALLADAGMTAQAAHMYDELLASGGLSDTEWFNAGVRLYGSEQYELAARMFRKSIEMNPHSRDAFYNLGQTLYALATSLEEENETAAEADKASLRERMTELNEELLDVAGSIRELDPNSRNALMMAAQAQRTFAELSTDDAAKKEWQDRVVATLEAAEAMGLEVGAVDVRSLADGTTMVSGEVTNLGLPAGQSITLEFTLYGEDGAELAIPPVTVTAGEPDTATTFSFEAKMEGAVLGWKYRVVS